MTGIFLTGATGAVGSCILEHVLQHRDERVYVLIRADSAQQTEARKLALLQTILGTRSPDYASRVVALRGDTKVPLFGLSHGEHETLAANCQRVIHSAGLVRMNLPIEEARESAVESARNVIALARRIAQAGTLEKVEFVSTVGVGGRSTEVTEDWIESTPGFHNTYEQAKFEAEQCVRTAISEGLPITVHRPSMVVGDTSTGRIISFQVFYHLCEFLSGLRSNGLFPSFGRTRLDTIPVDYVARTIVWSSGTAETAGRIMHLCSGPSHAIPIAELQRFVVREFNARGIATPPTRIIPRALFRAMLVPLGAFAPEKIRRAIRTAPIFLDYLASEQVFHNERSGRLFSGNGMTVPPTDTYLDKALGYYLDRRR